MIRSFLPVGQGAFYCECFEEDKNKINIVYDCGSLTNIKIVEKEIRNNFQKDEVIDALFISHLDEDHINGIPFLLKYCKVRRIYFPLISSVNKKIMEIYFYANSKSGFIVDFLENPNQALESLNIDYHPELIQIEETETERMEQGFNDLDITHIESGTNVFTDIDNTYILNESMYSKWLYIPFNFRQKERINQLMDNLEKLYGRKITEDEVAELWIKNAFDDRNKIKQAYKNVQGDFNTNSMTLFSGETDYKFIQSDNMCCQKYCLRHYYCTPSGCLYMGDYDASGKIKWRELVNAYKKYWQHIGCVQIPHHGSKRSFNQEFLKMNAFFIISSGFSNKYHHPHAYVIRSFLLNNIMPHVVTEQVGSAAFYIIE